MDWAAAETPADSTFAVIGYPVDRGFVEWFPALSGRENLTTWQGSEWVPGGADLRGAACGAASCGLHCLPEADYYVLAPACCTELTNLTFQRLGVYRVSECESMHGVDHDYQLCSGCDQWPKERAGQNGVGAATAGASRPDGDGAASEN